MKLSPHNKNKKSPLEKKNRRSLTVFYTLSVFGILLVAIAIITIVFSILLEEGVILIIDEDLLRGRALLISVAVISLVFGTLLSYLTSSLLLRPFNRTISAMNRLAAGDFDARISFSGLGGKIPVVREVSSSFNKMADELQNTEMLRGDFINNFSHEFKTPIVSISGFAKLLRRGDLTEAEREQYLAAIEEESLRLAGMATNVLKLTKIENQTILSDKTEFNVSEQIRNCVLLLESKWADKNIELVIDFDEFFITANEELLREVWINIFDNAVKFTPDGGRISICASKTEDALTVSIENTGSNIPKEKLSKIWGKFYQADESHSSSGNGVGLAIVRKIVELHGGTVSAESENMTTAFTVTLPNF